MPNVRNTRNKNRNKTNQQAVDFFKKFFTGVLAQQQKQSKPQTRPQTKTQTKPRSMSASSYVAAGNATKKTDKQDAARRVYETLKPIIEPKNTPTPSKPLTGFSFETKAPKVDAAPTRKWENANDTNQSKQALPADGDKIILDAQQAASSIAAGFDTPENRAAVKAYEDMHAARSGKAPEKDLGFSGTKAYVNNTQKGMSQSQIDAIVEKGKKGGEFAPYMTAEGVEKNVVSVDGIRDQDVNDILFLRGLGEDEKADNAKNSYAPIKRNEDEAAAEKNAGIRAFISSGQVLQESGYTSQKDADALRRDRDTAKKAMKDAEAAISGLYHSGGTQAQIVQARKTYTEAKKVYEQANYLYNAEYNYTEYTQNEAAKKEYDSVRQNTDFAQVVEAEKQKGGALPIAVSGIAGTPIYSEYYKGEKLAAADQQIIDTAYYIRATQGEDAAKKYLELYSSEMDAALSDKWLGELDDMGEGFTQGATKRGYDAAAGLNKFVTGIENVGAYMDEEIPLVTQNAIERAQGTLAQGYTGGEKLASDLIYNTANMAPSIAVSFVPVIGQTAGLTLMGASTLGSTYADTRREGYEHDEAKIYAAANAGSEVFMQRILGGLGKLGSSTGLAAKLGKAVQKAAKNPMAAKGLAMLGNMGSEGTEEYLQAVVDPIFRNEILGENNDINLMSEDKAYAFAIGALSALGMNAPADIMEVSRTRSTGRAYNSPQMIQGLINEGLLSDSFTASYKQAQAMQGNLDAGKTPTNYQKGSLAQANAQTRARALEIQDRIGIPHTYSQNEIVALQDGGEAVIVARDGDTYVIAEAGQPGYRRVQADQIAEKVEKAGLIELSRTPEQVIKHHENYDRYHTEKVASRKFIKELSEAMGVKIEFDNINQYGKTSVEGKYDKNSDTIYINRFETRANVINAVAMHEITHATETSKYHAKYVDFVIQQMTGGDPAKLRGALDQIKKDYAQAGWKLDDQGAANELAAMYTGQILYADQTQIDALVAGNRNMATRIYDAIKTAMQKLSAYFKGDAAKLAKIEEYQTLERGRRMFEKALKTRTPEANMEVAPAYSINRDFPQQIEDVINGIHPADQDLYIGDTSDVLKGIGFKESPMLMQNSKIKEILSKHPEVAVDTIKKIPELLEDPVMVIKSKTHGDESVVVITDVLTDKGYMVLPVWFDQYGHYVNVDVDYIGTANFVASAYGRNMEPLLNYAFGKSGEVLYANKQKSQELADFHGLQLPAQVSEGGFLNTIHRKAENVNEGKNNDADVNSKYSIGQNINDVVDRTDAEASVVTPETMDADSLFMEPEKALEDDIDDIESVQKAAHDMILTSPIKERKGAKQALAEFWGGLQRKFVDSGYDVSKLSDEARNTYNAVRGATQSADYNIGYARGKRTHRTDIFGRGNKGESLQTVFEEVNKRGEEYVQAFQEYMYHLLNTDRMGIEDRARENVAVLEDRKLQILDDPIVRDELRALQEGEISSLEVSDELKEVLSIDGNIENLKRMQNKPVFGRDVTAEASEQIAQQLLKENPEFADIEAQVREYIKNDMDVRVEGGLVSREFADMLEKIYPHYVPISREGGANTPSVSDDIIVGKSIGRAVGGDGPIGNLQDALARQTRSIFKQGRKNIAIKAMMDAIKKNGNLKELIQDAKYKTVTESDSGFEVGSDNTILFFENGSRVELTVTPELAEGFRALAAQAENTGMKVMRTVNETFKKLITQWNPAFIVRNFFKDFTDALIYSKHGIKKFFQSYGKAMANIKRNSEMWQLYCGTGGFASSIFENMVDADISKKVVKRSRIKKMADGISQANMVVEQGPRFAEFTATIESYGMDASNVTPEVLMEALYNANDITCNFGRSGTWGKLINKYIVPFFNPSIQGFDKLIRAFKAKDAKTAVKLIASFVGKSALIGMLPSVVNELLLSLLGDDEDKEEYARMSDYTKNSFYLVALGEGQFLRIPKGRIASALGNLAQGVVRDVIAGDNEDNKTDWEAYVSSTLNNVTPTNPMENYIGASAIRVLGNNKRWTGQDIETKEEISNKPVSERYDETTSEVGKFLSQKLGLSNLGISPKKADVLIDEGTGVIGDLLLPLTSTQASQTPLTFGFVQDSNVKNKRSGQVYDLKQKLSQEAFMEGTSKVSSQTDLALDFLVDRQKPVWDNKDKIREINGRAVDGTEFIRLLIGQSTRQKEVSDINLENAKINEKILENYPKFRAALEKYYNIDPSADEDTQETQAQAAYLKAYRDVVGAEDAIKTLRKETYENAQVAHAAGTSYDTYLNYYTESHALGEDAKKEDKLRLITDMNVSDDELTGLYTATMEDKDTKERNTIAYAEEQGVRPSAFVQRELQKTGETGQAGDPKEDAIWENGKMVVDENGTTVSGTKKAAVLNNLLNSGYTDEEKAYFYQKECKEDDSFSYYLAAGLPVDDYLSVKEFTSPLKADKDKNGKTITDSRKQKLVDFLNSTSMSEEQKLLFMAQEYKLYGSEAQKVRDYVGGLSTTDEIKEKILASLDLGGSSGGGGRRSGRRSGGKSFVPDTSPVPIPAQAWAVALAKMQLNEAPKVDTTKFDALMKKLMEPNIRRQALEEQLAGVDNIPYLSASQKAARKAEIRKQHEEGGTA